MLLETVSGSRVVLREKHMMRYRGVVTFMLLLLGLASMSGIRGAGAGDQGAEERIRALEEQNASLRATSRSQQEQLQRLTSALLQCAESRIIEVHRPSGPDATLPKGATPFEYNGMTFYNIPAAPKRR